MSISLVSFILSLPLMKKLADRSRSLTPLPLLPNQTGWALDKAESIMDPYRPDTIQLLFSETFLIPGPCISYSTMPR